MAKSILQALDEKLWIEDEHRFDAPSFEELHSIIK